MNKVLFFVLGILFFSAVGWASDIVDVEMAVLANDWKRVDQLIVEVKPNTKDTGQLIKLDYWQGLAAVQTKDYLKAQDIINNVLKNPKLDAHWRSKFYLVQIDALFLDERYEQAVKAAEEFVKLEGKSDFLSLGYLKLARAELKMGRWADARKHLNKIIVEFPVSLDAQAAAQLLTEKDYFSVQVGSFGDREKATQMLNTLKDDKENSYVIEASDKSGRKMYRVRVGRLASIAEAQNLRDKLSKKGYPTNIFP
ncbi:MAG: SPOR domain-containing protein [Candidatus Omnitrophica bacterium]|nr:SPOR domain-containing protein [Candidatus Omnitrophota bacterium]